MSKTLTVKVLMDARTEAEWQSAGTLVVPKGYIAVSLFDNGKSLMKIGNGVGTWSELPYINEAEPVDLSAYYTKDETDEKIASAVTKLGSVMKLLGRLETAEELPSEDNAVGDVYLIGKETDANLVEYYWTGTFWDYMGTTTSVDLSNYYTKEETEALVTEAVGGIDLSGYIKDTDTLILTNSLEG